jgi:adenylyltransferase/sulfurtransferase
VGLKPDPSLDARGLPPGYQFKPDWEVTPREVKSLLDKPDANTIVIDVREPNEYDITHIVEKDKLFPRATWMQVGQKLKGHENDKVVIHCRSGGRSLQVAQILRQQGFKDAKSMAGGILLWNKDVNPGGPQY